MIEVGLDFAFKVKDDGSLRQDPPKKKENWNPKPSWVACLGCIPKGPHDAKCYWTPQPKKSHQIFQG
jgi:hypothetical protein